MPKWMPFHGRFVVGDVYRWKEPVWKQKARKTSKAVKIGERQIVAQLTGVDGDLLVFSLMSCETKNAELWWKAIPELKSDKPLRKNRSTLAKRKPERRPWGSADGEPARSLSGGSRFLS
jgi:CRISPR/Cas system-associated endonuclease Cas1